MKLSYSGYLFIKHKIESKLKRVFRDPEVHIRDWIGVLDVDCRLVARTIEGGQRHVVSCIELLRYPTEAENLEHIEMIFDSMAVSLFRHMRDEVPHVYPTTPNT